MDIEFRKFREHQGNSRRRRIEFDFTFRQWTEWWKSKLGPKWIDLRGCVNGKYCMARKGDVGPYSPGNVICVLHATNCSQQRENGTSSAGELSGKNKITASKAVEIYQSTKSYLEIQNETGLSVGAIIDIRCGRTWKVATKGLVRINTRGRNKWK